ncbi:MAG: hypothetical protein DHS20C01_26630 [marine bacterium B5-7]|nr:MAG: hypothetical protein DHS20C01_26630 [marine bacterium B5-7]
MNRTVKGLGWIMLSGIVFVTFLVIVRLVGTGLHSAQTAFIRYLISVLLLSPFVYRRGLVVFYTNRLKRHILRAVLHSVGVMLWFYAITTMPIAEATALSYATPIFVIIGASLFLGEHLGVATKLAVVTAFIGVLIMLRPGHELIGSGAIALLVAAPLFAASKLLVKTLVREDSTLTVVVYLSLVATITMLIPALLVWRTPTIQDLLLLTVAAVLATMSHYCLANGLKLVDVSVAQPAEFLRLVWSALFGLVLFNEVPDIYIFAGAALVVASVSIAAHREVTRAS